MSIHRELTGVQIHVPYAWAYADATARAAASGFITSDVGKLARQMDNNSLWILTDDSPTTWVIMGGVPDHGALTGLGDDDHTQYHTDARGDARYSLLAHNHNLVYEPLGAAAAAVAALVDSSPAALDTLNELAAALGDDSNFAATMTTALAGKAATVHAHATSDVTGLDTALASKQASLVSGTNIKTINGLSVLGSGDIVIEGGTGGGATVTFPFYQSTGTLDTIGLIADTALPFLDATGASKNIALTT